MSSRRKVAAADVPLHTLDSPEVLDAVLGPSSSQGDDVKLLKPAHAEAVPLTSTHWRLTAKVPGGETSSSSGLTTDVSGLEPLVSIPDVPESLERYVSVAVMALQGSSASTARDSSKAAEAVKEALAAVAQAASSAAPAAGDEGKLLTANEFAILTATSTALAVIEAFSSSSACAERAGTACPPRQPATHTHTHAPASTPLPTARFPCHRPIALQGLCRESAGRPCPGRLVWWRC